ncbi:transcriptional regulator, RpiR family [Alkalibacterium subtropicum]|uniref:Transcriptional regulator, RpiR family n=1 Tax=Alkalibacterium subtropicum TaxID=753702 RepID=A0A1I1FRX2_9LACT|nr:MurR/RpiR family transcriptional regulator [Alkalibacterium subtropicum]SFB99833.1 transcriptional regulator, RpiR family [Alkalibacterium subtropicum]
MLHELINKHAGKLSENDYYMLNYVQKHTDKVKNMTILELSKECNMSKSSVLRLTKKLGFSGYSEFKYYLKEQTSRKTVSEDIFDLSMTDVQTTLNLFKKINKVPIYELIKNAETIYAYGTGWGQQNALQELKRYLLSMNKYLYIIPAKKELQVTISHMKPTDLVIFTSLSGEIDEIMTDLKTIHYNQVPTVSITNFKNNHLAKLTTHQLYFQSTDFGYAFNVEHKSFIGLQLIIDHLVRGYLTHVSSMEEEN